MRVPQESAHPIPPTGAPTSVVEPTRPQLTDGKGMPSAPPQTTPEAEAANHFPIVGIGASAGGLEAVTTFLKALAPDTGMAFVLVQHMEPTHHSMLDQLLAKDTAMPVAQVVDGMKVDIIPPNTEMTISGGFLRLVGRPVGTAGYRPIDTFLCALAEDQETRAIGIIFSGIGSDGTKGLQAIKAEGGITFAQDEESAKYSGMPRHAVAAGCVDLVLPPDQIARELARMIRHPYLKIAPQAFESEIPAEAGGIRKLFRLLRSATGVDFSNYKQTTIQRRIARRMLVQRCETLDQYAQYAAQHPEEVKALFEDVLIHVTSFFRDAEIYDFLKASVLPRIVAAAPRDEPIRIWVPGCSSGEEVYSLAIVLMEVLGEPPSHSGIQIFGTDISEVDIQKARAAMYPESIATDVSAERLRRFFVKTDSGYQVAKFIRAQCIFARHDVTKDPPFSRMDLISCRNVMIYFGSAFQKKVLSFFHYALKPSGFLVLGKSESVSATPDLFSVDDRKANVYRKIALAMRPFAEMKGVHPEGAVSGQAPLVPLPLPLPSFDLRKAAEHLILSRYSPPALVVDSNLLVVYFQGDTSPFLKPQPGESSLRVLKLVRQELMLELRTAIQEAKKWRTAIFRENVRFKRDGQTNFVDLEVEPINGAASGTQAFVVLFHRLRETAHAKRQAKVVRRAKTAHQPEIEQLRRDLALSQEHLRSVIEDQEAATEEVRAANEEILSSNEELQSTNEELETAKEELQSSNEELATLNDELQKRNLELSQAASDLDSLLNAVEIPIVILGNDLCIRRFTSTAQGLLNLIPSDVGRPISQIRPNLELPNLDQLASEVIDSSFPLEKEVRDKSGHWYALRVRPYRTAENRLDGILIAVVDIHDLKELSTAVVETIAEPLLVMDSKLRVTSANAAFYQKFQTTCEQTEGKMVFELGNGQWNIPALRELFEKVLPEKQSVDNFKVKHDFPQIGTRTMLLNARQLHQAGAGIQKILLVIHDITDQKQAR
jgi:two-component system CheB/CheR fusion protein